MIAMVEVHSPWFPKGASASHYNLWQVTLRCFSRERQRFSNYQTVNTVLEDKPDDAQFTRIKAVLVK